MTGTAKPVVSTIGYAKKTPGEIIDRLKGLGVDFLIDVRRYPNGGRREFRRANFGPMVQKEGLKYAWWGQDLGFWVKDEQGKKIGRSHPRWDEAIAKKAKDRYFLEDIKRIADGAKSGHAIMLMCACGIPEKCHCKHLIAPALKEQGIHVKHFNTESNVKAVS